MDKNGSDLCNFYSKIDFWKLFYLFVLLNVFFMFHNNTVKISESVNKWNFKKNK